MRRTALNVFAFVALFVSISCELTSTARADDWPQFLGPSRNGVSAEKGLIDSIPASGPKIIFRVPAGGGMAGMAIQGDRLVTMSQDRMSQFVVCLNSRTGETIWRTPVGAAFKNGQGDGPRATPAIHGDWVHAFSGDGVLTSLQLADGKVRWSKKPLVDYRGKVADFGMACSPLVVGDAVVVTVGARQATLAAFNAKTGEEVWKLAANSPAGYSSPALLKVGGQQQLVAFTGDSALGVAPQSGELLWRYPYQTDYECNTATPIAVNGDVFLSSGENHGSVMLQLKSDGSKWSPAVAWESQGARSVLRSEWQTTIQRNGYLYGFDNVGSAGPVTHLTCVEAATGKRVWQELRFGKGNLIAADGKLLMTTTKGELVLAAASPKAYQELGRSKLCGFTRHAPVLANGRLYVRDDKEIICVDVRK